MDEEQAREVAQRIQLLMKSDSEESFAKFLLGMRHELSVLGVSVPAASERMIRTAYEIGYTDALINLLDHNFINAEQMLKEVS